MKLWVLRRVKSSIVILKVGGDHLRVKKLSTKISTCEKLQTSGKLKQTMKEDIKISVREIRNIVGLIGVNYD